MVFTGDEIHPLLTFTVDAPSPACGGCNGWRRRVALTKTTLSLLGVTVSLHYRDGERA